jgi:hypothetical protein
MGVKVHNFGSGDWAFQCPGCGYLHSFRVSEEQGRPQWTWNGSLDQPTFAPSLLVNRHYPQGRCHLFLENGQIKFQNDCHHSLAGKTVECPDWED